MKSTITVPFPLWNARAHESAGLILRFPVPCRIERLVIQKPEGFVVEDFKIGNRSQFFGGSPMPAMLFSPEACGPMIWEVVQTRVDVELRYSNTSEAPATIDASLVVGTPRPDDLAELERFAASVRAPSTP